MHFALSYRPPSRYPGCNIILWIPDQVWNDASFLITFIFQLLYSYKFMKTINGKTLQGTVVSDKMDKTVVVLVQRFAKHPKYQKYQKFSKKYKAHDENNSLKVGDAVTIRECRPMSKDKNFEVVTTA